MTVRRANETVADACAQLVETLDTLSVDDATRASIQRRIRNWIEELEDVIATLAERNN